MAVRLLSAGLSVKRDPRVVALDLDAYLTIRILRRSVGALDHLRPEAPEVRPLEPARRPQVLRVRSPGHHAAKAVLPLGQHRVQLA